MKATLFDSHKWFRMIIALLVIGTQGAKADVLLTPLEGNAGAAASEGYASLIDGRISSKWCMTNFNGAYIIFKASEPTVPSTYYLVTGGDTELHPDRNWKTWKIYGANFSGDAEAARDADSWVLLDQKQDIGQDQIPPMNTWTVSFVMSEENTTPYTYFKIEVEEVFNIPADNKMQMAEFSFDDPTPITYTALTGVAGFNDAESYPSLVDGSSNTKWCSNLGDWFIVFKANKPFIPTYYCLSTGNDTGGNPGRNWKDWNVYGGNFADDAAAARDAEGWTLLDERTDVGIDRLPDQSYTDAYFAFSNTQAYQYYKVEIPACMSGAIQQMSEIAFGEAFTEPRVKSLYYQPVAAFDLNIVADKALLDAYKQKLTNMDVATELEQAIVLSTELKAMQPDINASRDAYTTYQKTVDYLRQYLSEHHDMSTQGRKLFEDYLNTTVSPNANYPNGSFPYIMEQRNLSIQALGEEVDYLYELLEQYGSGSGGMIEATLETYEGTAGVKNTEDFPGLTDGDQNTKWCVRPFVPGDCYVIMHASEPIKPTFYSLTTANDTQGNPGRNWKTWRIYAGNFDSEEAAARDAEGWVLIDEKKNIGPDQLPAANFTTAYFYLGAALNEAYSYFRIELDEVMSGEIMQMSEFAFFNQGNLMSMRNDYYEEFAAAFDFGETVTRQVLVDEYQEKLAALKKVNSMSVMETLVTRLNELRSQITTSATNYANYIAAVETVQETLMSGTVPAGPARNQLEDYLNENIEPGALYPNGSYLYIMATRLLDDRAIQFETAYVQNLLEAAINASAVALRGTLGYTASEGFGSLVDGNTESKWAGTYDGLAYVVFKTGKAIQPFFYTLVTGNDTKQYPGRNWKDWTIYGGNFDSDDDATQDAEGWTLIDQKTGIGQDRLPAGNFTEAYFGFSQELQQEYRYFKVEVTASYDGNAQQMSELIWGDQQAFQELVQNLQDEARTFVEDKEQAEARLLENYQEKIDALGDAEDMETAMAFWLEVKSLQTRIDNSVAAYTKYSDLVEYMKDLLSENDGIVGEERDKLEDYLVDYEEPGERFPNGSYEYIIETLSLNVDDLTAEMAFVRQMMENILRTAPTAGTDVSLLLQNPDFSEGFNGWEGEATSTDKNDLGIYGAVSDGKAFDLHQTVKGLKNGYYLVGVNGVYHPNGKGQDTNYGAYLYAGDQVNYIQTAIEDLVSEENAVDKENCSIDDDLLLVNDFGEVLGYTPKNAKGMAYAIMAGRYGNELLVKVTDGTLTLGLCDKGTTLGADWTAFGNFHLIYIGEINDDDIAQQCAREGVISQSDRAKTLLEYVGDVADFKRFPNFSEDLRNRLRDAVNQTQDAFETDPEKPYQLTQTFTDLFQEVYECKRAYVALMNTAEIFYARVNQDDSEFTEEQKDEINTLVFNIWEKWEAGAYTTEEAWAQSDIVDNPYYLQLYGKRPDITGGVYQIRDAQEVRWLATAVNGGDNTINAVLAQDIDLTPEMSALSPIGNNSMPFKGKFDGQGHKITGFNVEAKAGMAGFFGKVQNADIRNFSIEGRLVCAGASNGAIAFADASTITNVHSALQIEVPNSGVTHTAGIAGECQNGTVVSLCSFSGTLKVDGNNNDCFGGICGYTNTSRFENCANYGQVIFSRRDCYAGGIVGYINNSSCQGPHNCLNLGSVLYIGQGESTHSGAIIGWLRGFNADIIGENWYLDSSAPRASGQNSLAKLHSATAGQLASGEICYELNHGQSVPAWYQTLGTDEHPVLDASHLCVYRTEAGTFTNDESQAGHEGTEFDPFVVKSAADLCNLVNILVSGRMNYIVLDADIDLAGVTNWKPLFDIADQSAGYPRIDFDGRNHVIRNLTSDVAAQPYNGLFGVLCGNVRNLGLENVNVVSAASGTGVLAGYLGHPTYGHTCYVENVWVTGRLEVQQGYTGGLFGHIADESHLTNCYTNLEVIGATDITGGIIGRVRNKVVMQNVYAAGSINRGGGIVGGAQQEATPASSFTNVAVWNNTAQNFGPTIEGDELTGVSYFDGSNFAHLQQTVVAWDADVWYCDMAEGSYPVLAKFTGIGEVASQHPQPGALFDLQGRRVTGKPARGLYIIDGRKVLVK